MIPVINPRGETEFNLVLGRKFLLCCINFVKAMRNGMKSIRIYDKNSSNYTEVKNFIETVFKKHYRAEISVGMPQLMAVIGKEESKVISAVGIRSAADSELFLEQYLDQPIEKILEQIFGHKVERKEIVEIGSLASGKRDAAKFLYSTLATYLKSQDFKYGVMTGTQYLQKYFRNIGMKPRIIAEAKQERLRDQSVNWGTYYKNNPKVMVMEVKRGQKILGGILGISISANMTKLYPHLSYNNVENN